MYVYKIINIYSMIDIRMNEYSWLFSITVHHFMLQAHSHSEAKRINRSFSVLICKNDECCRGWMSIMRTQAFGRQQAQFVNHLSALISAIVQMCRDEKVLVYFCPGFVYQLYYIVESKS